MVSDRRVGTLYREVGSMKRFITMTAVELRIYQAHVLRGCWQSETIRVTLRLATKGGVVIITIDYMVRVSIFSFALPLTPLSSLVR